jgi:hypothetical protein
VGSGCVFAWEDDLGVVVLGVFGGGGKVDRCSKICPFLSFAICAVLLDDL